MAARRQALRRRAHSFSSTILVPNQKGPMDWSGTTTVKYFMLLVPLVKYFRSNIDITLKYLRSIPPPRPCTVAG